MTLELGPLGSERLLLEMRQESHAYEVYEPLCEKDIYHYMVRNVPESKEWLAEGFRKAESLKTEDGNEIHLGWIARDKSSLKPIGIFELFIAKEEAFIAYTIFKEFWGKGFAVEGAKVMIECAQKNYRIKRFVIEMDTRNRASTKVAEKLGFEFVRVKNNATFLKDFVSHEFEFQKLI